MIVIFFNGMATKALNPTRSSFKMPLKIYKKNLHIGSKINMINDLFVGSVKSKTRKVFFYQQHHLLLNSTFWHR